MFTFWLWGQICWCSKSSCSKDNTCWIQSHLVSSQIKQLYEIIPKEHYKIFHDLKFQIWILFWNKTLVQIRTRRLTWYFSRQKVQQANDVLAVHTSTQPPQDGVHSESPPPLLFLSHRHKCCGVSLSGGREGMIGTHKLKHCTAAKPTWPHPGRAHRCWKNLFFSLFCFVGFWFQAGNRLTWCQVKVSANRI